MSRYRQQLEGVARAVAIRRRATCYWYGVASPPVPRRLRGMLHDATVARDHLVSAVSGLLYANFFCPGAARPGRSPAEWVPPLVRGRPSFVEQLRQANHGRGFLVDGWQLDADADGTLTANRDGLRFKVDPGDVVRDGTSASLWFPKEFLDATPGFYLASSDEPFDPGRSGGMVRLYWNLEPAGAVRFLAATTRVLNQAGIGFRLKTVNDPTGFDRCDNTVLYLHRREYPAVVDLLTRLYHDIAGNLRTMVPALTRRLAPGVGLAEDPGADESFGSNRCRLVAQAIVRAYERDDQPGPHTVLAAVEDGLAGAGVDPQAPYLSPGSQNKYALWTSSAGPAGVGQARMDGDRHAFLEGARRIAGWLCQQAIWYEDRCTWLGFQPGLERRTNGLSGRACRPIGPNLYQGTSGVGLFLAELSARTGERHIRRTALAALRQALTTCDRLTAPVHRGLYTGWSGVAYASARAGRLLGEEELITGARVLVKAKAMPIVPDAEHDLLSGTAGAVIALLRLAELLMWPDCLDPAIQYADGLAAAAHTHQYGISWPPPAEPAGRNLTGLSHGTAGIGSAFVALFGVTGDPWHRTVAERAFGYEAHWYDEAARNWPDFRAPGRGRGRYRGPRSYALAWCHGAPGIALSRLHAAQTLGGRRYFDEARTATATTFAAVRHDLPANCGLSLCHGTVGNADVLLSAGEMLPDQGGTLVRLARETGEAVLDGPAVRQETAVEQGLDVTPGLMQGLAGAGLFLLRLHDRSTPSGLDIFAHHCRSQ